ncbi:MAG TPA: PilN domain-containing protein [Gaiellaceae bacterium]|nr:PilN domain-containing protein [Gaiellaceae bacterium]
MVDLHKEIKLSDLFRRRGKDPDESAGAPADALAPELKPKRTRRALFARPPREQEPKRSRRRREKTPAVEPKDAPALVQVPLLRAIDLMPKDEVREQGARTGVARIAVALLGLLLFAGLAAGYLLTSAGAMSKQGEVDDLRAQLAGLEVPAEEPAPGAAALVGEGAARTSALSAALASRIAWDRVLRGVSLVVPEDVWLTQLSASTLAAAPGGAAAAPAPAAGSASPNSLAAVGFAGTQESVALFLSRLESIPELTSVQLQASTRTDGESGRVFAFTIVAGVNPLGAQSS